MPSQPKSTAVEQRPFLIGLLSATAGIVVANNYYSQPLLGDLAREFSVSDASATWISSATQLGYALGLLVLLPLGDMLDRRNLISTLLIASAISLVLFAIGPGYGFVLAAGCLVGFTSIVPQTLPPVAAQIAGPGNATGAIGKVMAGLLLGIVLSRFVGGWGGEYIGWRNVYLVAAGLMLCLLVLLRTQLPSMPASFKGSYSSLMATLWTLWKTHGTLRKLALAGAFQFGAFSLFWGTIGFHLHAMPQHYSASVTGSLALVGAAGVLAALAMGRVAKRLSPKSILAISGGLMIFSFLLVALATDSLFWTVPAVVLLDLGMQMNHVTSMASVLKLDRAATSRLNTVYMVVRFLGAALGTCFGGAAWDYGGWLLSCAVGGTMCAIGLVIAMTCKIAQT
jgi:predicted MFS family arabinose efflux permease